MHLAGQKPCNIDLDIVEIKCEYKEISVTVSDKYANAKFKYLKYSFFSHFLDSL